MERECFRSMWLFWLNFVDATFSLTTTRITA